MTTGNYDVKDLYVWLDGVFTSVSDNRFVSSRPKSSTTRMTDFLVIVLGTMYDRIGLGSTTCRLYLYAKDKQDLYENLPKLKSMQDAVYVALPASNGKYQTMHPNVVDMGEDSLGFHCWMVQFEIVIK